MKTTMGGDKSKGLLIALGIGAALGGLIYALNRQAKGSTLSPGPGPSGSEWAGNLPGLSSAIKNAQSIQELNQFWTLIGGMQRRGEITINEYNNLYMDYLRRFYEITGVTA